MDQSKVMDREYRRYWRVLPFRFFQRHSLLGSVRITLLCRRCPKHADLAPIWGFARTLSSRTNHRPHVQPRNGALIGDVDALHSRVIGRMLDAQPRNIQIPRH